MKKVMLFGVVAMLAVMWTMASAGDGKKSDSVVKVKAKLTKSAAGKEVVVVSFDIDRDWHLYANPSDNELCDLNKVVVKIANASAVVTYPPGVDHADKDLGNHKIYKGTIEIRATLDRPMSDSGPVEIRVDLSSCSDKYKKCLPPTSVLLTAK